MNATRSPDELVPRKRLALPPVLEGFAAALVLLTALCVFCEVLSVLILHWGPPYASPFLIEYFPDLTSFVERFQHLHHLAFYTISPVQPYMYPAPMVLPYAFLFHLTHPLQGYLACVLGAVLVAVSLLTRALLRHGLRLTSSLLLLAVVVCLSYPLLFLLKQANMEGFVWIVISLGLFLFFSGRSYAAAACFGIAGAMKLFPLIYLGLLLSRRQYRQIAWALLVGAVLTCVSLWVVYPNLATSWHLIQHGLDQFRTGYMLTNRPFEKGFDHSLWGLIKRSVHRLPAPAQLAPYLTLYLGVVSLGGVALYFLRIRHLPIINQVLCLTVASILLPPTSFDYTLIHLYAPWALLALLAVRLYGEGRRQPGLVPAMACFAVLMAPETEFIHHGETLGGAIKALTLIVLFLVGLSFRFEQASPDSEQATAGGGAWA